MYHRNSLWSKVWLWYIICIIDADTLIYHNTRSQYINMTLIWYQYITILMYHNTAAVYTYQSMYVCGAMHRNNYSYYVLHWYRWILCWLKQISQSCCNEINNCIIFSYHWNKFVAILYINYIYYKTIYIFFYHWNKFLLYII